MKIVIKIGGSVLYTNGRLDSERIISYVEVIKALREEKHSVFVVIGGGSLARDFIQVAKKIGANKSIQDWLGITIALQNARLFISAFDEACPSPPKNFDEILSVYKKHNLIFLGGLQPGQSTNAVAALVSELVDADFLFNLTDVDGVYDKDPDVYPEAKLYDEIGYKKLYSLISSKAQNPGNYELFDMMAIQILERSKIKLKFLNGKKPEEIIGSLSGKKIGTTVKWLEK